jgi:hypothetical protein
MRLLIGSKVAFYSSFYRARRDTRRPFHIFSSLTKSRGNIKKKTLIKSFDFCDVYFSARLLCAAAAPKKCGAHSFAYIGDMEAFMLMGASSACPPKLFIALISAVLIS